MTDDEVLSEMTFLAATLAKCVIEGANGWEMFLIAKDKIDYIVKETGYEPPSPLSE